MATKNQEFTKNATLCFLLFVLYTFLPNILGVLGITFDITINLILEIILTLLFVKLFEKKFEKGSKITKKHFWPTLFKIFCVFILFLLSNTFINIILSNAFNMSLPNNLMLDNLKNSNPIYFIISVVITSPILESIFFYGTIREIFRNNKFLYFIVSSLLYGAFYICFSYTNNIQLLYMVTYFVCGFCLSYSYYKTDNIYYPIGVRMIQGFLTALAFLLS